MTYHPRSRFIETVKDRIARRLRVHAARTFIAVEPNGRRRPDIAATSASRAGRMIGRKFTRADPAKGWIEAKRFGWRVVRIDDAARRKIRIVAVPDPPSTSGDDGRGEGTSSPVPSPRSPFAADEAAP